VSNPNRADASSWGSRNSVAANLIDHEAPPSLAGAARPTSVQYSARVPSHGISPRFPRAMMAPVSSQISISLPLTSHPAEQVAPTRPSGTVTLMVLPRRSHPEGQNTLTFKVTSVPASTAVAGGRLSATLVGCLCGSLFARSTSCFLLVSSSICGKEIVASGNL